MKYPIAPKAKAGGAGGAVAGAVLYVLARFVFKSGVPADVQAIVYLAAPGLVAFAAAWLAPHQHRDPAPQTAADERKVPPTL